MLDGIVNKPSLSERLECDAWETYYRPIFQTKRIRVRSAKRISQTQKVGLREESRTLPRRR